MQRLITALLVASLVVLGFVAWQVRDLNGAIDSHNQAAEGEMQTITSTWTSGHTTHTLTSVKNPGPPPETDAAFAARHAALLAAMQTQFPPNP